VAGEGNRFLENLRAAKEDQVPETHLLRLIDKHVSFEFVREQLKDSYSETRRPSIDPEFLLRILLIGYLYGITSERKLVEELHMHLAWRWFTGLGFDQEIPHHSTFSKNRHGVSVVAGACPVREDAAHRRSSGKNGRNTWDEPDRHVLGHLQWHRGGVHRRLGYRDPNHRPKRCNLRHGSSDYTERRAFE
jgi:hypothetical protein